MKILLTGASGFVGSSFLKRFGNVLDLEIHGMGRRKMPDGNYTSCDLAQGMDVDFEPDVVIHAAARSLPWGSMKEFKAQNVTATQHVLDFCETKGVKNLVYISSSSVFYKETDQELMTEESSIGPGFINRYAQTKYEGECLVRRFPHRWVILRPRAVFGPGDTVLFPRILAAALAGKMYRFTREGPPARGDLIYIDTLCDYMMKAATDADLRGEFNLTNDQPVEIEAFLWNILRQLDIQVPTKSLSCRKALMVATAIEWIYRMFLPRREPPITRFGIGVLAYTKTFDVTKALDALGPPSVSLDQGLDAFITWQRTCMS